MSFKNVGEIYKALLDGKKVTHYTWDKGAYVHLLEGYLMDEQDLIREYTFFDYDMYYIYKEPKEKVKVVAFINKDGDIRFAKEGSVVAQRLVSKFNYNKLEIELTEPRKWI